MRTFLKIFAGVVIVLVVLFVVAAVLFTRFFDPNAFKGQIAAAVQESTGRELVIPGQIELSYFPWLGFEVGEVRLGNPPGFGDGPFLELAGAGARVKLLPLLSRRLEVSKIVLEGARVNLAVDRAGNDNWTFTAPHGAPGEAAKESEESEADRRDAGAGAGEMGLAALSVGGVEVSSGAVTYRDARSGLEASVTDLTLTAGAIASGDPVDLAFAGKFEANEPSLAGSVDLDAVLQVDPNLRTAAARKLDLTVQVRGADLPPEGVRLSLNGDAMADLAADRLTIEPMSFSVAGVELDGTVQVAGLTAEPVLEGSLQVTPFNLKKVVANLGIEPAPTADPDALTSLALSFGLKATGSQATVSNLIVTLDDTRMTGTAGVVNFAAPTVSFDIQVDAIDIDRYLTADTAQAAEPEQEAAPVNVAAAVGGVAVVDADGKLTIGKLKVANLNAAEVSATLKARKGLVTLAPLKASLYDGSFDGSLTLDGRQERVRIATKNSLSGVQIGPLLKDAAEFDRVTGVADVSADLTASGTTSDELMAALDGDLRFAVSDGLLRGINVDRAICQARGAARQLQGKEVETCDPEQDTRFNIFQATATVNDGVARNDDLLIEQQRYEPDKVLRITGAGSVDLPKQTVDYRVEAARMERTQEGSLSTRGTPIPVRVTGTFENIKVMPDLSGLVKEEAKSKLQEKLGEKLKDEEGDSDSDRLKKELLRGLFGQ
ncbi:MAG: AsmA family protein [Pseudomonadota bacterium]|nr:AsmA family protein [Pseudomonadota bacterium]